MGPEARQPKHTPPPSPGVPTQVPRPPWGAVQPPQLLSTPLPLPRPLCPAHLLTHDTVFWFNLLLHCLHCCSRTQSLKRKNPALLTNATQVPLRCPAESDHGVWTRHPQVSSIHCPRGRPDCMVTYTPCPTPAGDDGEPLRLCLRSTSC